MPQLITIQNLIPMKQLQLILILAAASLLTSCATILTGTTQRVTIDSTPSGAEIIIDGRMMGVTPSKVRLNRDLNAFIDNGKYIQLMLPGYLSDVYYLGVDIEPTTVLNVFCLPGFAIDAVTGAIMKYDTDYYNFRMVPLEDEYIDPPTVNLPTNQSNQNVQTNQSDDEDDYEKLMKLVDLYEKGLITEEEFEKEKAKIFEDNRE